MALKSIIAIDGMGGDLGPEAIFKGLALLKAPDCHFIIFGDRKELEPHIKLLPDNFSYEIRHTDVVVTSDMEVISAVRMGKQSSMGLAIQAVKNKEAIAVVSSGNTGLYMSLAKIILNTIEGIDRPAIASVIPGKNGPTVCLDLGANSECIAKNLVDFAILGEALARSAFNKKDVKLAILNIGTESVKGSRLVKKTSEILKKLFSNYVGFVEGNDICNGNVDVIVTDGFTGNVALKTIEGTAKYIVSELKSEFSKGILSKLGMFLSFPTLMRIKKRLDPRLYNGAILVGLNGIVVKSHGNSDEVGFANAVRVTLDIVKNNMFNRVQELVEQTKLYEATEYLEGDGKGR